jgi:alginate O-acetyltransferase complex protein AlgI
VLFSSLLFLLYFLPVVIVVNYLLGFSRLAQNIWLFIASLFFYAWGEPLFVLVMLASIIVNWVLGLLADSVRGDRRKTKILMIVTCGINLGLLFAYKYLGFVIRNINSLFPQPVIKFGGFALPLGISFFTFQAMSYVIDVVRGDAKAERNPFFVGLYIAFFPQLIAGPIVRYADVAEQIRTRKVTLSQFSEGCCRFVCGFGKKVLIANNMAAVADHIFNLSAVGHTSYNVPALVSWLGVAAYTFQIFYDFAGYSDMAIGLGKMFGFEFKENFDYPYISTSITEFWRRWHISLSTWFREYLYFPLGGSRVENSSTMVRNTFIVWLCTGIWHGAEWTFILWGMWNFIFIMFERISHFSELPIPKAVRHVYTILIFGFGWMLFRAQDFYQASQYVLNMFAANNNGVFSDLALMFVREYWIFFLAAIVFSTPVIRNISERIQSESKGFICGVYALAQPLAYLALIAVCVTYLAKGSYNPFIYFNF